MIDLDNAYSRPEATAARLEKFGADLHRFPTKSVCLTGEVEILLTGNGRLCFLNSIRLLIRTFRNVSIWIPEGAVSLRKESEALAKAVEFGTPVTFFSAEPDWTKNAAILNVGHTTRLDLPWTSINSNGWLSRVTSTATPLQTNCSETNPIAALFAACMGVSEVFKRALPVPTDRFPLADGICFNLYSRKIEAVDSAPPIVRPFLLPLTWMVGLGAIGNGVALLMDQIAATGEVVCVDKQKYGNENLGTCALLTPSGIGSEKAEYIATYLEQNKTLKCLGLPELIESARKRIGKELTHPKLVLTGLDQIDPRHETQDIWPDLLIDGAIGDFTVQVATHTWPSKHVCLKCLFPRPDGGEPTKLATQLTGLSEDIVRDPNAVITDDDIRRAPIEKRELLIANRGRKVCSVVSEESIKALSKEAKGFSPSVPFVACASAALMLTAVVQWLSGNAAAMPKRYYFDILQGPVSGDELAELAKRTCQCQQREALINIWRTQNTTDSASDLSAFLEKRF